MKFVSYIFIILIAKSALAQTACYTASNSVIFNYNGHSYKLIKELKSWANAATCAVSDGGYLVEIADAAEQTAVYNGIVVSGISTSYYAVSDGGGSSYVWIGATDKNVEGTWLWDGNNDNGGTNFWNGQGQAGVGTGSVVGTNYINFGGKSTGTINEPDDYNSNQDCAGICLSSWPYGIAGEWNDIAATNTLYYVIEYNTVLASIKETTKKQTVNAYPNPASSQLSLEGTFMAISLYTIEGKRINIAIQKADTNMMIDISHLPSGAYFLKCTDLENNQTTQKIIITNSEQK